MGGVPQRTDLLGLPSSGKSVLLHTQCQELLEVVGLGITAAGLPPSHRFSGDAQELG